MQPLYSVITYYIVAVATNQIFAITSFAYFQYKTPTLVYLYFFGTAGCYIEGGLNNCNGMLMYVICFQRSKVKQVRAFGVAFVSDVLWNRALKYSK
jgi:hypothetical protein